MILPPMGTPGQCPKHERAWTPGEDELLISLYGKNTAAEMAALLPEPGRTPDATAKRLEVLRRLYPNRVGCICRRYTKSEDDFIRKNCHTMTVAEIAAYFGDRTPKAVKERGARIGVNFYKCGEQHRNAKYQDDLVMRIQKWRDDFGLTFGEIDRMLGTPKTTARHLYNRLTADYAIVRDLLP
ncbi:TPA: SANT/Myb domain-containing protein [Klebsiella oxytoca]|uniref:SANT/Myb domain-containing protein n=1 Tax=Klebsiella oxytoca TaxID=571 RepID=A0AAN5LBI9_KLEOX|nr:SANT/Myb domain-containing protein [Klebsiella oxytoca]